MKDSTGSWETFQSGEISTAVHMQVGPAPRREERGEAMHWAGDQELPGHRFLGYTSPGCKEEEVFL